MDISLLNKRYFLNIFKTSFGFLLLYVDILAGIDAIGNTDQ
jgi:hypothetical protein